MIKRITVNEQIRLILISPYKKIDWCIIGDFRLKDIKCAPINDLQ